MTNTTRCQQVYLDAADRSVRCTARATFGPAGTPIVCKRHARPRDVRAERNPR